MRLQCIKKESKAADFRNCTGAPVLSYGLLLKLGSTVELRPIVIVKDMAHLGVYFPPCLPTTRVTVNADI
jgi:hypothetical protein